MDRRSRCPRSLRGLALESIRAEPETLARLETPLLGHRSAPECRLRPDLLGYLGLDTGLSVGPNHCCHLLEGLDREHGADLSVARLVAPHARDRPELGEQAWPVAVDGNREHTPSPSSCARPTPRPGPASGPSDASSTRDVVGARRSILGATLLDGLTGPSAGCRRLLRQFIRGLAVPERSAVCERATWRKDNRFPSGRVGRLGP